MGKLGEKLTAEMTRQGMKVPELAKRTNVKEMTIRRVIWGQVKDPGVNTMAAIAKGLGRSVDFFLWEFPPQDSYMSDVIEFFTYRWPELDEEQKQHLVGLLRMMLREHEVSRIIRRR